MTKVSEIFDYADLISLGEEGYVREQRHPLFPELAIYNYTPAAVYANVWNDVTRQCRGLIVDWNRDGEVIARPFEKFWSAEQLEGRPDLGEIPVEEPFRIFDKADGSLGIVYPLPNGEWAMATRGSFASEQAVLGTRLLQGHQLKDYVLAGDTILPYTCLFEIVGPSNRVVLDYEEDDLIYLGCVDIRTGQFTPPEDQGLSLHSIPTWRCIEEYHSDVLQAGDRPNKEGYVLWWPHNNFRLKVKHEEYKRLHSIVTMANTKTVWRALMEGQQSALMDLPDEFLEPVKKLVADFERKFKAIEIDAKMMHAAVSTDFDNRKDQAMYLNTHVNSIIASCVFRMLDGKPYGEMIWRYLEPAQAEPIWGGNNEDAG